MVEFDVDTISHIPVNSFLRFLCLFNCEISTKCASRALNFGPGSCFWGWHDSARRAEEELMMMATSPAELYRFRSKYACRTGSIRVPGPGSVPVPGQLRVAGCGLRVSEQSESRICVILWQLWHVWHCFFFGIFFAVSAWVLPATFSCSLSDWRDSGLEQRQQNELFHVFVCETHTKATKKRQLPNLPMASKLDTDTYRDTDTDTDTATDMSASTYVVYTDVHTWNLAAWPLLVVIFVVFVVAFPFYFANLPPNFRQCFAVPALAFCVDSLFSNFFFQLVLFEQWVVVVAVVRRMRLKFVERS